MATYDNTKDTRDDSGVGATRQTSREQMESRAQNAMDRTESKVQRAAEQTEAKVQQAREQAESKIDQYRHRAVDALHTGGSRARDLGERAPGQMATRMGRRAGERLDEAAEYVYQHSVREMSSDWGVWMKRNPGPSMAMAAVAGFMVGRALRR